VTVGLRRGGLVAPVLILPLAIPVMIFGVGMMDPLSGGGATLFLLALSLVVTAFSPFAAALALRTAGE
jgi:heme exporter protein B